MLLTVEQYRLLSGDDTTDAAAAAAAISAAQSLLEAHANRWFEEDTRTETVPFDRDLVLLRAYPVVQVESVEGTDAAYQLDGQRGILRFPRPQTGTVTVTYTGGYAPGEIPQALQWACAALAQTLSASAQTGGKQVASERLGDYSATFSEAQTVGTGLGSVSRIAEALVQPFRGRGW